MAEIHYISIDEARDIHLATIRNSGGGDCGELDIGKLESVLCHIQNDDYYPTFLDLLRRILAAILTCTYDSDEELKLDIFNAISVEDVFY